MPEKVWCEHFCNKLGQISFQGFIEEMSHPWLMPDSTKFCPICGTPRPVAKTLAEKFAETSIVKGDASCGMSYLEKANILAKIAEEHFK